MSSTNPLEIRGYLIHLTHYDPRWVLRKNEEEPFRLKVGREIVDSLADIGFNMLLIGVSDGVEYKSHPELKRRYSLAMEQLEEFAAYARDKGLEIVPKLNFSRSEVNCHDCWNRKPVLYNF